MYSVSNAFKEQMKSPIQEHKINGTIGSVSFDEANIVEGSFSISNQSTDTNDVVLGSCYVGQLTAEFVGINIAYGKWINKTITLSFGLKVGEYYEYVPLGVFKIKEAKHTDHGVQVTAYDNMIKFDKKFRKSHFMNLSGMTNIIDQLCTDAGVVCGMSHAQIEALPNGDRTGINIYGSTGKKAEFANDITTLRDLLFWVAQTLGCFATMNRAGQLEFRPYTQTVVDNIADTQRIEGATFADYVTHYIGIYVENLDDNTEDYYGYDATALQQELTETMGEITADQGEITDLEADRADWVQKLANHECTQQEYDEAIAEIDAQEKVLTKEINQLSKRAEWLSNAIAQSADDGSDMVLGANPLVMAKNKTTRDEQRREILGALSNISYTPFQALVLCGCIYDLGDVIQWSGGLYNSDTDSFGCVMQYTYTHNGGTELEGFGVDPSVVVVRNKTQKSTDRATRNATTALNENDLVFGIDPDKNNAVVATNKKAYTQSLTTRVIYIWAYNVAWPPAAAIYKVTITSDSGNFAIVDATATSGRYPCDVNGIIRYDSPAWLVWELPEGSPEPNITVRSERVWDNGYHPEYTLGEWWANGYNHCVYTENGVSWYANGGFGGSIQHGIAYEYGEMPDENFESEAAMHSAIFTGKVHPAGVSPYDQDMLATESTAMQAAANAEYLADKIAGNNPSRKSETFYGSVNVMSEKTMERLSQAFYSMGENVGSITNNVDDVKVDNVSVVTNKVANITMPVTDVQVNGSSVLSDKVANIVLPVIDVQSDGTSVITNNIAIINTMTGATASAAGTKGLVPAPASGDNEKYLRGDGTWQEVQGGGGGVVANSMPDYTNIEVKQPSELPLVMPYDGYVMLVAYRYQVRINIDGNAAAAIYGYSTDISISDLVPCKKGSIITLDWSASLGSGGSWNVRLVPLAYGGGSFCPIVYSTEEREVGVWTDGKPLYQKTYSIPNGIACNAQSWTDTGITNNISAETVVCGIAISNSKVSYPIIVNADNANLYLMNLRNTGITIVSFTVQYTKTTDVAGSGKYTTLGVPSVHYDGEERVIGTWFGETLYQKTYRLSSAVNLVQGQWTAISEINTANIHECITVKAMNNWAVLDAFTSSFNESSLMILNNRGSNITVETIVLEYTKTTD